MGFFKKLKDKIFGKSKQSEEKYELGLTKSRTTFSDKLEKLAAKHRKIDEAYFDELLNILITSDVGVKISEAIVENLKEEVKIKNWNDQKLINEFIIDQMFVLYTKDSHIKTTLNVENDRINVIMVIGVNGSGKTTSIAKLANKLKNENKKVIIAACDTFRAGAVQQLNVWAQRIGVDIVMPAKEGQDPASVVFDGVKKAKEGQYDVLIIDTAGRLQNKINLMNELNKMYKIIQKEIPDAPHECLLVLDATTGQNGLSQAKSFHEVTKLTGIILTKMDGTSKGGIVLAIKEIFGIPVKMLGLGEKLDDLQEFDIEQYLYSLTLNMMKDEVKNA